MITESLAASIRARGLFSNVIVDDSDGDDRFVLNGAIERLEEVDRGRDVTAVCGVAARLVDPHTRAIIWSRAESATVPVTQRDVTGVVRGLTAATRAAVDGLVASLEKQLAPGGPRP